MDKQKQIEEMAKVLDNASCQGYECENCFFDDIVVAKPSCVCVKALYNAGYRKIPEGAVVLTRERYEELEKAVDSVQVAVSSFTRLETIYKIKCKELELAEEKARKETVEKIAHAIEALLKERFIGLTLRQHLQRKGMEEGLKMALEIAKEITEGSNG